MPTNHKSNFNKTATLKRQSNNKTKRTRQPSSLHNLSNDTMTTQSSAIPSRTTTASSNSHERGAADRNSSSNVPASTYLSAAMGGGSAVKRIRTPHEHDVLSGRGGGVNSHKGNSVFREWVRVRKNDYNLARDKHDKALVAQEVIELVRSQNPPGRFLQKDPSSIGPVGWWIELDEEKVLAKTAQALREGAPQIRAEHREELAVEKRRHEQPTTITTRSPARPKSTSRPKGETHAPTTNQTATSTSLVSAVPVPMKHPRVDAIVEQLRANAERALTAAEGVAPASQPPTKRVRVDYNGYAVLPTDDTPPLLPAPHPPITTLPPLTEHDAHFLPPVLPSRPRGNGTGDGDGLKRAHSLALSDISLGEWAGNQDYEDEEFVNPFEGDELHRLESIRNSLNNNHNSNRVLRPGVFATRDSSTSSHGDLGGLSTLLSNNSSNSLAYNNRDSPSLLSRAPLLQSPRWTNQTLQQQRQHQLSHSDSNRLSNSESAGVINGANSGVRSRTNLGNLSSRSLPTVLSDLPDATTTALPLETDFTEGMKTIYDALHWDDGDNNSENNSDDNRTSPMSKSDSVIYPFRGFGVGSGSKFGKHVRRRSSSLAARGLDGRQ